MSSILTIVAPVFGLIMIGYVSGRLRLVSQAAGTGIADFAFTLAIPALLCRTVASAELGSLAPVGILGSFYSAGFLTWAAASLATVFLLRRPVADAPAISMTSTFGNTIMLGIPLAMGVYGAAATPVIALVLAIHAPTWWLTGMLQASTTGQYEGQSRVSILKSTLKDLIRNPIVLGILAGALWRLTGAPLPAAIDRLLQLMAQASVPTALVALGLSLVNFEIKGQVPTLIAVTVLKLVYMPVLAWIFATYVFGLDDMTRGIVTILAAMPTGANAFLFATRLGRAIDSTSGAVALGSLLAALTAALLVGTLHAP
ncbi:MAG: AEC family transporter [Hyphomicrobiaceae bacterium]|nr:AEC family transporter [Hyphomicrobiaceae bacterium]MCC0008359.1 AEC family transporter [Hyphomicrobiaceae bacterium]